MSIHSLSELVRWLFSLKSYQLTEDPSFGDLFDGEEGDLDFHFEWALAKLITVMVKDNDIMFVLVGHIRHHKSQPGTITFTRLLIR